MKEFFYKHNISQWQPAIIFLSVNLAAIIFVVLLLLMPLFDFKCNYCTDVIEINENIPPACKTCGEVMQRIWSAPAVKFNGSGFYSTGG